MHHRKMMRMEPFRSELEACGVEYTPSILSCFGRPHADAKLLIQSLARRLARRKGTEVHVEERCLVARLGLQLWRRVSRMVRYCLPETAEDAAEPGAQPVEYAAL